MKKAIPTYVAEIKKELGLNQNKGPVARELDNILKAAMPDIEKMLTRYALLHTRRGGHRDLAPERGRSGQRLRCGVALAPKANSELAKIIAALKPTGNRFAGLLTPDTVAGFKTRLPFFNDELKSAAVKMLEEGQKEIKNAPGAARRTCSTNSSRG